MKFINAPSKIIGVQLGSLDIVVLSEPENPAKKNPHASAKFGLITEGGDINGSLSINTWQWSAKTQKALEDFVAVLEEEAASKIFKIESEPVDGVPNSNKTKDNNEPAQF